MSSFLSYEKCILLKNHNHSSFSKTSWTILSTLESIEIKNCFNFSTFLLSTRRLHFFAKHSSKNMCIYYFSLWCFHVSCWFFVHQIKTFQFHSKLRSRRFDIDSAIDSWFKNENICFLRLWRKNDFLTFDSKKRSFCYV